MKEKVECDKDIKGCDFKCYGCKLAVEKRKTHMENEHVKYIIMMDGISKLNSHKEKLK